MTPPRSMIGWVLDLPWLRDPLRRRLTFAALAIVLAVLCFFPEHYEATAELMPQESGGGLSAVLAQQATGAILDLGALAGNKTSIEADLAVARSEAVTDGVIANMHLTGPKYGSLRSTQAKLQHKINIVAARGSMLLITVDDTDPEFAKSLANAAAEAIRQRLAQISIQQAADKRAVATNRLADASIRLDRAKQALTDFRQANHLPAPEAQMGAGVSILAGLQSELKIKQAALAALRQTVTDDNVQVISAKAEIAQLQGQIAAAQTSAAGSGLNLQGLAETSQKYYDLNREYLTDEILFQVYSRYLDEIAIDEMSAMQNMNVVQPAYIEPSRQLNTWAIGLLLLVLMTAVGAEYYYAATRRAAG